MEVEPACARIEEQGYCVLEDLLGPREAARLDARARRLMQREKGYVNLEGALNPMPELAPLCVHPAVMEIAGHFLGAPFYLANNVCMKWCQPGAAAGHLHSDWPLLDVPRPYPPWPMLLQTMWMLTDFTAENGATLVVPGSHLEGRPPDSGGAAGEVAVTGRRGSLLIWHGTLWHRAAASTRAFPRACANSWSARWSEEERLLPAGVRSGPAVNLTGSPKTPFIPAPLQGEERLWNRLSFA